MKRLFLLFCMIAVSASCRSVQQRESSANVLKTEEAPVAQTMMRLGFLDLDDLQNTKAPVDLSEADLQSLIPNLNFATPTLVLANYPCLSHMAAKQVTISSNALESFFQEDLTTCIKNLKGPESAKIISVIARIYRRMSCVDEKLERYTALTFSQVEPNLCLTSDKVQQTTQIEWDVHYKVAKGIARSKLRAATFSTDQKPYCVINKTSTSWSYEPCRYLVDVIDLDGSDSNATFFPPYRLNILCNERDVANVGDQFSFDSGSCKGSINQWQTSLELAKDTELTWTFYDASKTIKSVTVDPRRIKEASTIGHLFSFLR